MASKRSGPSSAGPAPSVTTETGASGTTPQDAPEAYSPTIEVRVGRTHVAIVDAEDAEVVGQYRWRVHATPDGRVYAVARPRRPDGREGTIYMHRLIADTPAGLDTDHRDGNGLNNRRSNLRTATPSQNRANGPKRRGGTSRYRGVSWVARDKVWSAQVGVRGEKRHLGSFTIEVDAARAYDAAAHEAFGEFARPNFPEEADRGHA